MTHTTKLAAAAVLATGLAGSALAQDAVATMTKFYEIADARPMANDRLAALISDNYQDFTTPDRSAPEAITGLYEMLATGAPDSRHDIEMIAPVGEDKALVIWRYVGTNTNNLFGVPSKTPANGFDIPGMELWQVTDGKVTGLWHVEDIAGLMAQLNAE